MKRTSSGTLRSRIWCCSSWFQERRPFPNHCCNWGGGSTAALWLHFPRQQPGAAAQGALRSVGPGNGAVALMKPALPCVWVPVCIWGCMCVAEGGPQVWTSPGHGLGLPVGDLGPELVPLFPAGTLGPIHVSPVALSFPSCETEVVPALVLLLLVQFGVCWPFVAGLRLSPAAASGGAALPCGAWASLVAEWGSVVVAHGLRCSTLVGSSWTRDGTRVPCTGRWILIHCTSREVHHLDSCLMRCS